MEPTEQTDADLDKELVNDLPDGGVKKEADDEPKETVPADAAGGKPGDTEAQPPIEPVDAGAGGDTGTEPKAGDDIQPPAAAPSGAGDAGTVQPAKVAAPTVNPLAAELAQLTAAIEADDFDHFSKEGKRAILRRQDVSAELAASNAAANMSVWDDEAEKHGKPKAQLRNKWNELMAENEKRFGPGGAAWGAAKVQYEQWVAEKPKPPKQGKAAPTPITASGGRVIPPAARGVPPQPEKLSDEDELVKSVTKATTKVLGSR